MLRTFTIGSVEHTKGLICKACFNGYPENCPSVKCDGYIHGHQLTLGASIKVESACDMCGRKYAEESSS